MSSAKDPTLGAPKRPYPQPLVILPSLEHKSTFIILHGRGSTGPKFSPELLATELSDSKTLLETFPNTKFVFPTASKRRALVYKRSYTHQWFDNWHLTEPTKQEELQAEGLRETSAFIHTLLQEEISYVGAQNVVLWGLSQGCAASLVALLAWDGEPFAATVGMCGWIPFRSHIENIARNKPMYDFSDNDENPFGYDDDEVMDSSGGNQTGIHNADGDAPAVQDSPKLAIIYLRDVLLDIEQPELRIPQTQTLMSCQRIPVFLGHGVEDERVFMDLGRDAVSCLEALNIDVCWKEYDGLGHWYSKEMLHDIVQFLRRRLGKGDGGEMVEEQQRSDLVTSGELNGCC